MSKKISVLVDNDKFSSENESAILSARPQIEDLIKRGITTPPNKVIELEVGVLTKRIDSTLSTITGILDQLSTKKESLYQLDEISFSLGIDSTGEVSIVSTVTGSVSSQVGLNFKFSRRKSYAKPK